jgi:hypothetical protein
MVVKKVEWMVEEMADVLVVMWVELKVVSLVSLKVD